MRLLGCPSQNAGRCGHDVVRRGHRGEGHYGRSTPGPLFWRVKLGAGAGTGSEKPGSGHPAPGAVGKEAGAGGACNGKPMSTRGEGRPTPRGRPRGWDPEGRTTPWRPLCAVSKRFAHPSQGPDTASLSRDAAPRSRLSRRLRPHSLPLPSARPSQALEIRPCSPAPPCAACGQRASRVSACWAGGLCCVCCFCCLCCGGR